MALLMELLGRTGKAKSLIAVIEFPEVAGWWVLCHKCPRVTDWVRVGYRSDQATTRLPICDILAQLRGLPSQNGGSIPFYGDKRTSVVSRSAFRLGLFSPFRFRYVRKGSIASFWPRIDHFRSTPINGHAQCSSACLKGAKSRSRFWHLWH